MKKFATLVLALTALPALAFAGDGGSRQSSDYTLSQERPSSPTSEHFVFDYVNPNDPEAKPPAVEKVVTRLPNTAHFDSSVPGSCTATDAELMAQGADACPESSAIGGGVITVDTGVPGPGRFITADTLFFNNAEDPDGEFIYLNTARGTEGRTVIRADVTRRRTITGVFPPLPGTPPDGGSIDTVDVTVADVRSGGDAFITTPRQCPQDGSWRPAVRFSYQDGVTQTVASEAPCIGS